MRPDIHPDYRYVVFRDVSCGFSFLTKSCIKTKDTVEFEGETYPVISIDVSSESHPYYTGTAKLMDTAGRVDKFYKKYGFQRPPEQQ